MTLMPAIINRHGQERLQAQSVGEKTMHHRPTILVCDDDPLLLELIEFRLTHKGFDVVVAPGAEQALASLSAVQTDLVILDAMMPGMDGFELLRSIKHSPALAHIPVVMLTARKSESDIIVALQAGAEDYLVKPFILEELLERVKKILARYGSKRTNKAA